MNWKLKEMECFVSFGVGMGRVGNCAVCKGEVVENGEWRTVATARTIREIDNPEWAEWAAIVADPYHCNTIGSCLLYYLSAVWVRKTVECRSRTMRECACCTLW